MAELIDNVVTLLWIPFFASLAVIIGTISGCVVSRTQYSKGVNIRRKRSQDIVGKMSQIQGDGKQPRRNGVYSWIGNLRNLIRDRIESGSNRILGSHSPVVFGEIVASHDRFETYGGDRNSVRTRVAPTGSVLRKRRNRGERRDVEYQELPLDSSPCFAYKYGASDDYQRVELETVPEPRGSPFAGMSYGATYRLSV
ncbi:hypothetical protein RB195_011758 [Necator americanus]|uniref:Uncharacterized protein n=1 Tax=Necator americanus TaxID=51031 RepID=A0ABR1D3X6_NECAM